MPPCVLRLTATHRGSSTTTGVFEILKRQRSLWPRPHAGSSPERDILYRGKAMSMSAESHVFQVASVTQGWLKAHFSRGRVLIIEPLHGLVDVVLAEVNSQCRPNVVQAPRKLLAVVSDLSHENLLPRGHLTAYLAILEVDLRVGAR